MNNNFIFILIGIIFEGCDEEADDVMAESNHEDCDR